MFGSLTEGQTIGLLAFAAAVLLLTIGWICGHGSKPGPQDRIPGKDWHESHEDMEKQIHE